MGDGQGCGRGTLSSAPPRHPADEPDPTDAQSVGFFHAPRRLPCGYHSRLVARGDDNTFEEVGSRAWLPAIPIGLTRIAEKTPVAFPWRVPARGYVGGSPSGGGIAPTLAISRGRSPTWNTHGPRAALVHAVLGRNSMRSPGPATSSSLCRNRARGFQVNRDPKDDREILLAVSPRGVLELARFPRSRMASLRATDNLGTFLTSGPAADVLGVSPDTLRNWDRGGKVEALGHSVNGDRRCRREELRALLNRVPLRTTGRESAKRQTAGRGRR